MEAEMDAAGFLVLYMDSREQTGISPEERDRASMWTREHQGARYRAGHLLFRSRLLEMALAVARLMTGHALFGYTKTEELEAVIRREVPGFAHLPSFQQHVAPAPARRPRPR
jgi:hypothetical protein